MRTLALDCLTTLVTTEAAAQGRDSLLVSFTMEHRAADSSSLDLSFLLDAPAGKHGFVRVRDGHLARGDGARLRLWGIHLTDWSRGSVLLIRTGSVSWRKAQTWPTESCPAATRTESKSSRDCRRRSSPAPPARGPP